MIPALLRQEPFMRAHRGPASCLRLACVLATAPVLVASAACGGDSGGPPVPARVSVTPAAVEAHTSGQTFQFSARVLDGQGNAIPDASVTWSSRDEDVATVSPAGLATVVGQGRTEIRATAASATGRATVTAELKPGALAKVSGDEQTVPALTQTPEDPVVRVADAAGLPLSGVPVRFEVFNERASVSPRSARTDAAGEARTKWTVGIEDRQYVRAHADTFYVDFGVNATEPQLTVWTLELPNSRAAVPYRAALEQVGGEPPFSWSLASGTLPAGISLDSAGVLAGQAESAGSSEFTVAVRDARGMEATGSLTLRTCAAPMALAVGQVELLDPLLPAIPCAPFLPAGSSGDRYHVSAVRTITQPPGHVEFVLEVSEPWPDAGADRPAAPRPAAAGPPQHELHLDLPGFDPEADQERMRMKHDLLARTERIFSEMEPSALLPNRGGSPRAQRRAAATTTPAAAVALRPTTWDSGPCTSEPPDRVTANLVAFNDYLAIYQDSVQQTTAPVDSATAVMVLDYYADYGAPTIEEYFGGVTDVNGDGRVVLFVTPVVPNEFAAYVWGPDFLSASACAGSNEMEIVYYNELMFDLVTRPVERRSYQVMATTVHELKHIASLYRRASTRNWPPIWVEEGSAEIAGEVSARRAVEATGGVARTAVFDRSSYPPRSGEVTTPENSGVLLRLVRTALSYSAPRNSLVENPADGHTFYGTSWHFHRFLADAYGDAATLGDSAFFRKLNTDLPPGVAGIEQITGQPMATLLEEFAVAMTLNGTGAPQPERTFITYDFRSATKDLFRTTWEDRPRGEYPWPRTGPEIAGFEPARYLEYLHPGGILFHEFESDGRGQGIEIAARAGYGSRVRVVVARIR